MGKKLNFACALLAIPAGFIIGRATYPEQNYVIRTHTLENPQGETVLQGYSVTRSRGFRPLTYETRVIGKDNLSEEIKIGKLEIITK